jgi:ribosome-binding protein aMBF1 (putative translation factor)
MPLMVEPHVNNRLRRLRMARGLAQQELSIKASVSPTTLRAVERYDYVPSAKVRQRIAHALAVKEVEIWLEDAKAGDVEE